MGLSCLISVLLIPRWEASELKTDPDVGPVKPDVFAFFVVELGPFSKHSRPDPRIFLVFGGSILDPYDLPPRPNSSGVPGICILVYSFFSFDVECNRQNDQGCK